MRNVNSYIAPNTQVKEFLEELQVILQSKDCDLDILPKKKCEDPEDPFTTENTMLDLDYDDEDIKQQLILLTEKEYLETIKDDKDKDRPHFWAFGREIDKKEVYIKVKIRCRSSKKVFCVSFHYARFPLKARPYN